MTDDGAGEPRSTLYVDGDRHSVDLRVSSGIRDREPDDSTEFDELLEAGRKRIAEEVEDLAAVIAAGVHDVVEEDDLKPNSNYDLKPMVRAWVYRLIAPSEGYSKVSWGDLAGRLDADEELASRLGFDPETTPSAKTLREQWMTRVRRAYRKHVRYLAAQRAVAAEDYEIETADGVRSNIVEDFQEDGYDGLDPIGVMEKEIKEDAYSIQADIIRDICSYDRDDSIEWPDQFITDAGAHMCRLNDHAEEGIERMGKTYGLIEENADCSEDWDLFTQQTFRRTVRNVERRKISDYYQDEDDAYGARWLPPHELVEPANVQGELREALEESWTIDPHRPDGTTATWHQRSEDGIEQQIEWLRDEGVIDEDDSFNVRIDYTTHNYNKHSSTDSDPPIGVHKQSHLDTGYAWKELQGTIKINGRAFIIASLSYLPPNDQFQGVRYILDRARELVNVDTVMADAEFVDTRICRYIRHCGCDYVIRKGATDSVKDTVADFEGRADWDPDWTLMSGGRRKTHDTTLVALEKDMKSVPDHKKGDGDDEDDEPDTTLDDFGDDDDSEPEVDADQVTLEQVIEESQEDDEEIDYFCMITSLDVESEGIDPDDNPVAHDHEGTAWGIGRVYRDRWGVETAFRDKKRTFAAKTRSRDLGYRRFLWILENLLYNGWVMLNTAVSSQSPDRDDNEIVVKQATYLDELDRRVLGELDMDLEFPEVDYG